jgi:hypothetical protein
MYLVTVLPWHISTGLDASLTVGQEETRRERDGPSTTRASWARVLALVKKNNSGDGNKLEDDV